MDKKTKILMAIIIVLTLVVGILTGYIICDKTSNNEPVNNQNNNNNNQNVVGDHIDDATKQKLYNDMLELLDEFLASEIGIYDFQQKHFGENYVDSEYGRSKIAWTIIESDKNINKIYDEIATGDLSVSVDDYSKVYEKATGYKPDFSNSMYSAPMEKLGDVTISNDRAYGDYVTGRYEYELSLNNLTLNSNVYTLTIDYSSITDEKIAVTIEVKFEVEQDNNYKFKSLIVNKK